MKTKKWLTYSLGILLTLIVLILAVGGGTAYFQMNTAKTQTAAAETLQTTVARKSDLVIYASGMVASLVSITSACILPADSSRRLS